MKIFKLEIIRNGYNEPIIILVLFNIEFRIIISRIFYKSEFLEKYGK